MADLTLTPNQIHAAVLRVPQFDSAAVAVWKSKFKDPDAVLTAVEDMADIAAILFPPIAGDVAAAEALAPLLMITVRGMIWAAQNPGSGQNLGPSQGGKIGAGR